MSGPRNASAPLGRDRHRRAARRAAAILMLSTGHLPSQSPVQRQQIEAFRDSIAAIKDSSSLATIEKHLITRARSDQRDSAMVHLRLGFIALRLGDLGGKKHYADAASEFQWATELQPKWPYGWFGLGFGELGVGDAEFALFRGLQTALGKDALTRSANDFARSAEVDPGFVRGLVELSNTALRQRINLRMDVALAALRRAGQTPAGHNPEVMLARARVEREVGNPDSALALTDSLVRRDPGPASLLEQARARFRLGRQDGTEPWYRGLAEADPPTLGLYRTDLLFVLPDSTLRAFDAAATADRVALMRKFWNYRDRDELRPSGERLVEHYRRLDYARHNYRLASIHRHYDIIERYRPPVADFDDRGVVYIRQGTPDDRASLQLPGLPYNESWAYHRGDQRDLLFHFVAREGVTDFRLVESALDVLGYANAIRLQGSGNVQGADAPAMPASRQRPTRITADSAATLRQRSNDAAMSRMAEEIIRSRQHLNPVYLRLLGSGKGSASGLEAEERALGQRSIRVGTSTDNWPRSYAALLPAQVRLLATAGDSTSPLLRIAFAIPVAGVRSPAPGAFAPRLRVAVLSAGGDVVSVLDTIVVARHAAIQGMGEQYLGLVSMPVPAGTYTARVGLEADQAGVVSDRDTIVVAAPFGPHIGLSDLVTGAASVPLAWRSTHGDTVLVNPLAQFRSAESMQLYFEVSGTPRDSQYRIELVIKRPGGQSLFQRLVGLFGGKGAAMRLGFTQRSIAVPDPIHREISLQKLTAGRYVLEVTVSGPGGEKMTRRQDFAVLR